MVSERADEWSGHAEPASVRDLRQSVTSFAAGAGFARSDLDDLRSCVSEAVTNAIAALTASMSIGISTTGGTKVCMAFARHGAASV